MQGTYYRFVKYFYLCGKCCEYSDDTDWIIVQPNHSYTFLWSNVFGSKDALYIHPREIYMYMKASTCHYYYGVRKMIWIVISEAKNFSR